MRFRDRREAGRALAARLTEYAGRPDVLVLGLPRGGIPVAAEVADALGAPLEMLNVRKLGVPGHEELAMGAVAEGGARVVDESTLATLQVPPAAVERAAEDETYELSRRARLYRAGGPPPLVRGRVVILVDDGLATGATMTAAIRAARAQGARELVVAVPVATDEALRRVRAEADACVCLATPEPFFAVGAWYDDFSQTTDDEVCALLARTRAHPR